MATHTATDDTPADQASKDFFIARQPILDRDGRLYAYELLFREAHAAGAIIRDNLSATATVIAHVVELGLETVVGQSRAFLNIDAAVLESDFIRFLPPAVVVLEILETVAATPAVIARVELLKQLGYTFALDDVVADSADVRAFGPLVDIVKIDIAGMPLAALRELVQQQGAGGKKLLAEKVETAAEFTLCHALGFHYFQGYYFARPLVMQGKKLAASELALFEVLQLIDTDASNADIELRIKRDATITINLLRMVNTAAAGARTAIESLGQALLVLGRRQLQRWLQVMLYAGSGQGNVRSPLLSLAVTRAKLLELIVLAQHPNERAMADAAFAVGVMSLMDVLFAQPMAQLLQAISVHDDVRQALLSRSGRYGDLLLLAEQLEQGDVQMPTLRKMALTPDTLNALQLRAFEWANKVVDAA